MEFTNLFSNMVNEEIKEQMDKHISREDILGVLKALVLHNSPSLDGCLVESFLHLFDIMGTQLLEMPKEY